MADRYWVGGDGDWNNTAHWSTSSGGTGGASYPGQYGAKNVIFDENSFTGPNQRCNVTNDYAITLDITAQNIQEEYEPQLCIYGTVGQLTTYGNVTICPYFLITNTGYASTWDINGYGTNYIHFENVYNNVSIWRFNIGSFGNTTEFTHDAYLRSDNGEVFFGYGTFNLNSYTIQGQNLWFDAITNAGSSTIICDGYFVGGSGFNAGTGEIIMQNNAAWFYGGGWWMFDAPGYTYNKVTFQYNPSVTGYRWQPSTDEAVARVLGHNTISELNFNVTAETEQAILVLSGDQTIGTLNVSGYDITHRAFITSYNPTPCTMTVGTATLSNVDFYNILGAGAAAPFTGTSLGNGGLCSGITFDAGVDKYWVGGTGLWSDTTHWALTSAGGGSTGVPLPQDNVYFDDNSFTADSQIITVDMPRMGTDINFNTTNYNETLLFYDYATWYPSISGEDAFSQSFHGYSVFGNWTMNSHWTVRGQKQWIVFRGNNPLIPNTITSGGSELYELAVMFCVNALAYKLMDNLSSGPIYLYTGTFDANDMDLTVYSIYSGRNLEDDATKYSHDAFGQAATVYFGDGTWYVKTPLSLDYDDDMTSDGICVPDFAPAQTFFENSKIIICDQHPRNTDDGIFVWTGYGLAYHHLEIDTPLVVWWDNDGYDPDDLTYTNTFFNLIIKPGTYMENWISGESGTTFILNSFSALGTAADPIVFDGDGGWILSKSSGQVCCDYIQMTDVEATGGATWHAGVNTVDNGGNTGWEYTSCSVPVVVPEGEALETGVYTLGRYSTQYPIILDMTYPISEREDDGDLALYGVEIGSILIDGNDVYVAWRRTSNGVLTYGIDKVDQDNKLSGAYLETRVLSGNREQLSNLSSLVVSYAELPTGTDLALQYSKDYGTTWTTMTTKKDTGRKILYCEEEFEASSFAYRITATTTGNDAPAIERSDVILR